MGDALQGMDQYYVVAAIWIATVVAVPVAFITGVFIAPTLWRVVTGDTAAQPRDHYAGKGKQPW